MQSYRNTLLSLLAVIMAIVGVVLAWNDSHKNKQKVEALRTQLAHSQIEPLIQRDTIRDTVQVATSSAIPVERRTYKNELADKQLIKDLRLRLSQIETQQLSDTAILDTVRLTSLTADSYEYADRWTHFTLSMKPPDTMLVYTVSDSVLTLVYREYKHKFLWWRWGTKGYKVKVVNFNPHATIRYNQYIKVE